MSNLTNAERETHFNQTAEERIAGVWHIYTDDPHWLKRLAQLDIPCEEDAGSEGKHFTLETSVGTVSIRAKRQVSDRERARLAAQLKRGREK